MVLLAVMMLSKAGEGSLARYHDDIHFRPVQPFIDTKSLNNAKFDPLPFSLIPWFRSSPEKQFSHFNGGVFLVVRLSFGCKSCSATRRWPYHYSLETGGSHEPERTK
jgi:hypothetical protein